MYSRGSTIIPSLDVSVCVYRDAKDININRRAQTCLDYPILFVALLAAGSLQLRKRSENRKFRGRFEGAIHKNEKLGKGP